jgi:hypothetical protein
MDSAQTIQKVAFEGLFSFGQLYVLGGIIALLTAFFTFRECNRSGSKKRFAILFPLRVVSLLVVLWMLAGATVTTLRREINPGTVLFLVDSSESMGIVDPIDGSGNTARWHLQAQTDEPLRSIGSLHLIIGKLLAVRSAVRTLYRQEQTEDSTPLSEAVWKKLEESADATVTELRRLSSDSSPMDTSWRTELARSAEYFESGLALFHARPSRADGKKPIQLSGEDRFQEAEEFLNVGLRRLEHISQTLSAQYEQTATGKRQSSLTTQSTLTRQDKVAEWMKTSEGSWLKQVQDKSRVQRYVFASKVFSVPSGNWDEGFALSNKASAASTDLTAALERVVQDSAQHSLSAVVLITDGGHNTGGNPLETAASLKGVPFYIVPIGNQHMPRDVILHHTHCPRTIFKNDTLVLDTMLTAYDCEGEDLHVELLNGNAVVENKTISVSSKFFDSRIEFRWKAGELGRKQLRLRVKPLAKEHSIENNEAQAQVEVMEDTIRVLVADSRPRWEFRYLVNLFQRDKRVDFEQLLFEPRHESAAAPSLPQDLEGWRRYRVIILGDLTPEQFSPSQQELLRKFVVEESGNLIFIGGDTMPLAFAQQPLAVLLPTIANASRASDQPRSLSVTPEGSLSLATQLDDDPVTSDRIWRDMSSKVPVYFSTECRPKPTSHVLISARNSSKPESETASDLQTEAFLSWQYVGLGRVVYIAAPVTYNLRYGNGDIYHHRFWGQLLRWAIAREMSTGSKTVHLATDKSNYEKGDSAQIAMRLTHPDGRVVSAGNVTVEAHGNGKLLKLLELKEDANSPGVYRGTFDDLPLGPITLRAAGSTVRSLLAEEKHANAVEHVIPVDPKGSTELSYPLCNFPLLTQIADASGGTILSPQSVPAALTEIEAAPQVQETVLHRQPAWNRWSYLWIILTCLTFEWLLRKYWRMG